MNNAVLTDREAVIVELPHAKLTLDLTNPIWFGPYHGAKLAIFEAQDISWLTNEAKFSLEHSVTYFAIMTELTDGGDFVVYGHYTKDVPTEEVSAHIQSIVWVEYTKQKKTPPEAVTSFVPGPSTIQ